MAATVQILHETGTFAELTSGGSSPPALQDKMFGIATDRDRLVLRDGAAYFQSVMCTAEMTLGAIPIFNSSKYIDEDPTNLSYDSGTSMLMATYVQTEKLYSNGDPDTLIDFSTNNEALIYAGNSCMFDINGQTSGQKYVKVNPLGQSSAVDVDFCIGALTSNYAFQMFGSDGAIELQEKDLVHGCTTLLSTAAYSKIGIVNSVYGGLAITGAASGGYNGMTLKALAGGGNDGDNYCRIVSAKISGTGVADVDAADYVLQVLNNATPLFNIAGNGNISIGNVVPDGKVHIHTASAGTVTASTLADDLVIESNDDVGMSILTANNKSAYILFGDTDDNDIGYIQYNHSANSLYLGTNNVHRVMIGGDGMVNIETTTEATTTTDGSLQTDGGLSIVKDAVFGDDIMLLSDAAVLNFGVDKDVTITHVADTGLLLNAAMQLQFRDSAIHIASATDGHLDLTADTVIDMNGDVDIVSGKLTQNHLVHHTETPTYALNVAGINVLIIQGDDTYGDDVTIGGFTGGVVGQVLYITCTYSTAYGVKLKHAGDGGSQDIYLPGAGDFCFGKGSGIVLVCDGTSWFSCEVDEY